MTDNTETELVQVTQEDREAVARYYREGGVDRFFWGRITAGDLDDDPHVQAFARHRINSRNTEYICTCGLRVEPHRCRDTKGEF